MQQDPEGTPAIPEIPPVPDSPVFDPSAWGVPALPAPPSDPAAAPVAGLPELPPIPALPPLPADPGVPAAPPGVDTPWPPVPGLPEIPAAPVPPVSPSAPRPPVDPAPVDPAPVDPAPVDPAPVDPPRADFGVEEGAGGLTTLRMLGGRGDYAFTALSDGRFYVAPKGVPGASLAVAGIEKLAFADGEALLDPTGKAGVVARIYRAVLGRDADAEGLRYWAGRLESGATAEEIGRGFLLSPEFSSKFAAMTDAEFVSHLYRSVLGRDPEPGGLEYHLARLGAGEDRARLLSQVVLSHEANRVNAPSEGGAHGGEITRLYHALLDRDADAGGLDYWSARLDAGEPLSRLAQEILASPEYGATYGAPGDAEFVSNMYRNGFAREADAGGLGFWTAALGAGTPRADLAVAVSGSDEARIAHSATGHQGVIWLGAQA